MNRFFSVILITLTFFLTLSSGAFGLTINAVDLDCFRGENENLYESSTLLISYGVWENWVFDDRVFLEYDISGLSLAAGDTVTLDIVDMVVSDPGGSVGVVDVYSYYGDGEIGVDDFDAGGNDAFYSFYAPGEYAEREILGEIVTGYLESESIVVTDIILDAIADNQQYVGFRLSTLTSDRYALGVNLLPVPVLTVVPEPCTLALLGLGGLLIKRKRKI